MWFLVSDDLLKPLSSLLFLQWKIAKLLPVSFLVSWAFLVCHWPAVRQEGDWITDQEKNCYEITMKNYCYIYCTRLTKETLYSLHNQDHLWPSTDFLKKKRAASRCGLLQPDMTPVSGPSFGPMDVIFGTRISGPRAYLDQWLDWYNVWSKHAWSKLWCSKHPWSEHHITRNVPWSKHMICPNIFGLHYGNGQSRGGPKGNGPIGVSPTTMLSNMAFVQGPTYDWQMLPPFSDYTIEGSCRKENLIFCEFFL